MKILLDECTPRAVKTGLPAFAISTVQEMGWAGVTNAELLRRAEAQFDVFITTDQNLPFQQNLATSRLCVIVLPSNQVPIVAKLFPAIEQALKNIGAGAVVEIPLPAAAP